LDAIFYIVRSGCAWRLLPHDFPCWKTVYTYFRRWRQDGTWERLNTALREAVREKHERHPQPSAAILDSQSVKPSKAARTAATMRARKSRGASVTWWWIRWAWY
jgi:transposase